MNCSNCGSVVAPDAGFCRNCGAILRGRAASATLVPSAPAQGPVPPASGPEPAPPALADAGYWAPPPGPNGQPQPGYGPAPSAYPAGYPPQGYAQQQYPSGQPPPSYPWDPRHGQSAHFPPPSAYPGRTHPYANAYGTHTGPASTGHWGGTVATSSDGREGRRLQAIDLGAFLGAAAVLGSLFMAWYQFAFSSGGTSVSVSITALTSPAGGLWRWLMLVFSIAIMFEILLTSVVLGMRLNIDWPHRSLLALLCVANLALVIGAMVASPFSGVASFGLLHASLASGAYVGLAGAIVGSGAAALRLFTGPPSLTR